MKLQTNITLFVISWVLQSWASENSLLQPHQMEESGSLSALDCAEMTNDSISHSFCFALDCSSLLFLDRQRVVMMLTVVCQAPLSMGSPGRNTGLGCHFLLRRIFLTQVSNLDSLHFPEASLLTDPPGKPHGTSIRNQMAWELTNTDPGGPAPTQLLSPCVASPSESVHSGPGWAACRASGWAHASQGSVGANVQCLQKHTREARANHRGVCRQTCRQAWLVAGDGLSTSWRIKEHREQDRAGLSRLHRLSQP